MYFTVALITTYFHGKGTELAKKLQIFLCQSAQNPLISHTKKPQNMGGSEHSPSSDPIPLERGTISLGKGHRIG